MNCESWLKQNYRSIWEEFYRQKQDDELTKKIDAQERLMNAMEVDDVLMPMHMYEY